MSKKLNILMLDDGRQCLPFLRSLNEKGHYLTIACSSRLTPGYCSRYANRRLMYPNYFSNPEAFTAKLLLYVAESRPDVILSVGDIGVGIISAQKKELTRYSKVTVPDWGIFQKAIDKSQTMQYCMEHGIPCPHTYSFSRDNLEQASMGMRYPVIAKPRRGLGAVGLRCFANARQLLDAYDYLENAYGEMLVQEYIPLEGGTQYQAEAFLDANSKMKVCMVIDKPRFFPITGGTSTANVTINRPDIQESVRKLLEGIKWTGAADVDLILDPRDNSPKILEINPRVTAGIKIGFEAGIDYADLHLRLAMGENIPKIDSYTLGVYSRNLYLDMMWYVFANKKMRKNTKPSFFKFCGRNVCYQTLSFHDPLPFVGFGLGMMKKYLAPGAWKEKLGKNKG